ncbi:bacteriocin immunity protein [Enterobacter sp. RIT418]|uniref:bacteriocin immunity protein n=1 Tax=Enterobacter sp. RIT418 TaxID=2202164 RepID=UPI000D4780A2|nr:bacteriocin immunity protein [Enterobacter sp. RIT 418]RAU30243.1 bacteriocin immunity protein [Enterobacter sp. RIT 418]
MELKPRFEDYTENEFKSFIEDIFKENTAPDDDKLDELLDHFEKITSHPDGSDLIYHTIDDENCNPEGITKVLKEWRKSHGLPLFKDS